MIENAAREPEIRDLTAFLNRMGAHILGAVFTMMPSGRKGGDNYSYYYETDKSIPRQTPNPVAPGTVSTAWDGSNTAAPAAPVASPPPAAAPAVAPPQAEPPAAPPYGSTPRPPASTTRPPGSPRPPSASSRGATPPSGTTAPSRRYKE